MSAADHPLELGEALAADAGVDANGEFAVLFRVHQVGALRLAYLLCGDRHRSEEAVAEAFARVYPKWRSGRIDRFDAYVRRAVVNEVHRRGRRSVLERRERERRSGSDRGQRSPEDEAVDRDQIVRVLVRLVGCQKSIMSRDQVVFVDRSAEYIMTDDLFEPNRLGFGMPWLRRQQPQGPMRSMAVVVLDELGQDAVEMTRPDDQQVIETLAAGGADPPFRVGVRVRSPDRGAHHLGADRAPDVVEGRVNLASRSRIR